MSKKTCLSNVHEKLGATMVDFAGWYMPVQYSNVISEHKTTRENVGLFDISHMGEFEVTGENALLFLQKVMTNDISKLNESQAMYSVMCKPDGGVIDDLFVYKLKGKYLIVVNAGNIDKDFSWLEKNKIENARLKNVSERTAKLDIQGPMAQKTLQKLTETDLSLLKRFYSMHIKLSDVSMLISRTGYTGEDGFEIYFDSGNAEKVWNAILSAGLEFGIKPIGLGARDTLRIEACYSLYGHELTEDINPIEAGIGFVVKEKEEEFVGKDVLMDLKKNPANNRLHCFEMIERAVPREGYKIFYEDSLVGKVTSGTFSPSFKKGLGMALLYKRIDVGEEIEVEIRGKRYKAKTVKRPFYDYNGKQ